MFTTVQIINGLIQLDLATSVVYPSIGGHTMNDLSLIKLI
jgi:hypothetical protein